MRQGADRAALKDRKDDLYETPECATLALLRTGELAGAGPIWEPCAGRGAIARVLALHGFEVLAADLVPHLNAVSGIATGRDFLMEYRAESNLIVTNPPFKLADEFIRHGLALGCKFVALLRLMALEGAGRSDLIDEHLRRVWIGKERLPKFQREGWAGKRQASETAPFAWFVFEPGQRKGPIELTRISWRS